MPHPTTGVTPGPAVITARYDDFARDPLCHRSASAPLVIRSPAPVIATNGVFEAGARLTLSGGWWATDRCDSAITLYSREWGSVYVRIGSLSAGPLGAFKQEFDVPDVPAGAELVASQARGLELADTRGRPAKARCAKARRTVKTVRKATVVRTPQLGMAMPDAHGAFARGFKPVTADPGDTVRATQSRCEGTALSAAATVS